MTIINFSNCFGKSEHVLASKEANKLFGGSSVWNTILVGARSIFYAKKILNEETNVSSKMSYSEVYDIVSSVLDKYATQENEEVIEKGSAVFFDFRPLIQMCPASYNSETGIITYSKKVLTFQLFWTGFLGYTLTPEWVKYMTLKMIGHERRHAIQDPKMFPENGTGRMGYFKHQRQACEIDADVAGHSFAKEVMGF